MCIYRNLNDYHRRFNDAMHDVDNVFLDRASVMPLIFRHFIDLTGGEYYTIGRMVIRRCCVRR